MDFEYFCRVKWCLHIVSFLVGLAMLVACSKPTKVEVAEPCRSVEGPPLALSQIDTLMWHQPDSALAVMMEFAGSVAADSMDVFEGHYCQVLIAELLYKNDYGQSNRGEVLKAVHYFDSVVGMDGADTRGVSAQKDAFLDARAHYINGVGYYERDSVVAACSEYLKALEIMETLFPDVEMRYGASIQPNHIPRFLCLIYSRLAELFSGQFMQEPAIACFKKAIAFNSMEPSTPDNHSSLLLLLGKQYHKLNQYDSAVCYFDEATRVLPDTNNLVYRDIVVQKALLDYNMGKDVDPSLDELKRIAAQAMDEKERLNRYMTIGCIYHAEGQYDSAWAYLMPVYESTDDALERKVAAHRLLDICQRRGDSVKANLFAPALAEVAASAYESQSCVSTLNELFQVHLQWQQQRTLEQERQQQERQRAKRDRWVGALVLALIMMVAVAYFVARRGYLKRMEQQRQEADRMQEAIQRQLADAHDALKEKEWEALMTKARAIFNDKEGDFRHRIIATFETAYPQFAERLNATYPDLTETERHLVVLNLLHFRAKEEAALLNLTENTVLKYRSQLNKKVDFGLISTWIS